MAAKFIAVLSLAVAASAIPLVPVAKYAYAEAEAPAHYEFQYSVHDEHTGDIKQQQEARAGDDVHGSYSLVQPDGVHRIVEYTSDKEHGFNAIVRYEGHPIPQPAPAKIAYAAPAKIAYATPAKITYAAPAKIAYSAPISYAAPVAKVAYAPVAKVAYAAHPLTQVTFSSPAISYHH
nr:cuticle protein 7-like [Vanessa tameamea]